jgi:hypothetical protein
MLTLEAKELRRELRLDYSQGKKRDEYLAEFIQRADAPAAGRLNSHDLMQPHDMRRATSAERSGRMFDPTYYWSDYRTQPGSVTYAFLMTSASSLSLNLPSCPRFKLQMT